MFKNILFFDYLLTPRIMTVLYWIALIVLLISAIITLVQGRIFGAILGLIFGGIGIRIVFELVMIAFKNNEYLRRIAEK